MNEIIQRRKKRSAHIAVLLKSHGRTQKDLAEYLGYAQNTISERSMARVAWDLDELDQIAMFLEVPIETLFA